MLKRTLAMITSVLVAASPIGSTVTHAADVNRTVVNINASTTFQTIDNFGASDAWSMDPIGKEWSESNKEKIADLLFSRTRGSAYPAGGLILEPVQTIRMKVSLRSLGEDRKALRKMRIVRMIGRSRRANNGF